MTYENCTSADACGLGPSMADICGATTTFLTFMSLMDKEVLNDYNVSGLNQRIDPVEETNSEYDFIIIGGGAGGSVTASRLSENSSWNCLLLEAGQDEPVMSEVPGLLTKFLHTAIDWNYTTTGEPNACLTTNGSCYWPAGKTLGGSTILAGPAYLRGVPADYEDWSEQYGVEGWSWEDIALYFLRSENNLETELVGDWYHSTSGPLPVSRFPYLDPLAAKYLEAAQELNYTFRGDLNGDYSTGFTELQFMSENGIRRTPAAAFLWPIRDRTNLHVSLNSLVTKIIIEDGKAVGVQYYKNGEYKTVTAKKEIILSAGVIRSPQVLLLSGIGPKEDLEALGIPVAKDLPGVGENLQNHVSYFVQYSTNLPSTYDNNEDIFNQYMENKTGPLSSIGLSSVAGFVESSHATEGRPDLLIYPAGHLPGCAPGAVDAVSSSANKGMFMIVTNTRTESTGKISLASSDPLVHPVIFANYFSEQNDIDILVEGIEVAMKLMETTAYADYGLTMSTSTQAACSDYEYPSTEYWACAVKQNTVPENHQGGSCKMGSDTDSLAVVDSELRVYGIEGLRILDASVMPKLSRAVSYLAGMIDEDGNIALNHLKRLEDANHAIIKVLGSSGIRRYSCDCPNGKRTVGCCSHIASIIYYLSNARYLEKIIRQAEILTGLSVVEEVNSVIKSDSDEEYM